MPQKAAEDLPRRRGLIIAIDGPAGSGKSTTARLLARRLGYRYLDTGAMYRAVTLKVLRHGLTPRQVKEVIRLLDDTHLQLEYRNGQLRILLDGEDVSDLIRSPEVDREISWVSQIPEVRKKMVQLQRQIARDGGIVAEGRDMGTVVFPDADLKIFLVASVEERGRRRWKELRSRGIDIPLEEVVADIRRRDEMDSTRQISPLKQADDAVVIDTTGLTIEQQVEKIVQLVREAEKKRQNS